MKNTKKTKNYKIQITRGDVTKLSSGLEQAPVAELTYNRLENARYHGFDRKHAKIFYLL